MLQLFRDLKARVDNPLDDGRVDGQVSLADRFPRKNVEGQRKPGYSGDEKNR